MQKNLRWRILLIVAVVGLSLWAFIPPEQKVKLGLDLKGGVHLVLSVQTDDALRLETDLTIERLREALETDGMPFTSIERIGNSPTEFRVNGVQDRAAFQARANEIADAVFNRSAGAGDAFTFTMRPNIAAQLRQEAVNQALETIERRVNELGVAEPLVARQGAADQILVQLPGVEDVQRAKDIISTTALLELKLVEDGPYSTREAALQRYNNELPSELEILPGRTEADGGVGGSGFYVVRRAAAVAGSDLRSATHHGPRPDHRHHA